ncbi:MAG: hypothetical protein IPM25_01680 [Chloracidobacterium sp.]|nr:hypothetical protein [Chloracidobacterium sp.]
MISEIRPYFVVFLFLPIFGCGGDADTSGAENSNRQRSVNSSVSSPSAANNSIDSQSTNTEPGANSNALTPIERMRQRRAEGLRESPADPNQPLPTLEETLARSSRPAPENSEFSVALTDILFERRTFRDHPVIAKVEKVTRSGKSTVTLFAKDGRQIVIPDDAIGSLSTVSTQVILRAAGIQVPVRPPAERKPGSPPDN